MCSTYLATVQSATYAYTVGGGTATAGSDYTNSPSFSNGVTLVGGNLIVPAGVTSFTVSYPTLDDAVVDSAATESLPLTIGGVTATGGIIDNDQPTISSIDPGAVGAGDDVVEGQTLTYTVTLSTATVQSATYA